MAKLFLVPTPVGNLEDMTYRAVRVLKEADLILAEDTRTSANLLKHYGIETKAQPYHQYNEHAVLYPTVCKIATLSNVCLITDAGTPGISDPGFLLVRECIKVGIEVECLPGATALIPALVCSGLSCEKFVFEGFLPHKKGRNTKLQQLKNHNYTFVLYESPFRLVKTLEQLKDTLGNDRCVCVSREISKVYEEHKRGSIEEVLKYFKEKPVKGEIVIVVEGNDKKNQLQDEVSDIDNQEDNVE